MPHPHDDRVGFLRGPEPADDAALSDRAMGSAGSHALERGHRPRGAARPMERAAPLDAGGCRGLEDRVHVQAMNAIEVGNVTGLTEVVDAERIGAVARHAAEPREARGMPVDDGDERGVRPEGTEQPLDVRRRARRTLGTGALRGRPAGVEAIGGGHGEQPCPRAVLEGSARAPPMRASGASGPAYTMARSAAPLGGTIQ